MWATSSPIGWAARLRETRAGTVAMSVYARILFTLTAVLMAAPGAPAGSITSETSSYIPAYFAQAAMQPGDAEIILFPFTPVKSPGGIRLPGMQNCNLYCFGPDGRSVYVRPSTGRGINRIDFGPTRERTISGSTELGVMFLTVTRSGRLLVAGHDLRTHTCGAYELDPNTGSHRPLRTGDFPDCGGALGRISPDGAQVVSQTEPVARVTPDGQLQRLASDHLRLVDLRSGASRSLLPVQPGSATGSWSPDGRWIAAKSNGRIVVIDANNPAHKKKLGAAGVDAQLIWSPDSRQLLFAKAEWLRCFMGDDAETLAVVDIETGKQRAVESSHCAVQSSAAGWIDPAVLR